MIRINLLPFRAARKKENIKRQMSIFALLVALVLILTAYSYLQLNIKVGNLKNEEGRIQIELVKLEETIKEIGRLEKQIKEIRAKLTVIKRLEENKAGPVHLLEEVSAAVPKDKLWLKSFQENKGILKLEGTAMDNETVAEFMTNLESSDYINTVDLGSTRMRTLPKYKLRVSDFTLNCTTYAFEQKKPATKKKTRRRGKRRAR